MEEDSQILEYVKVLTSEIVDMVCERLEHSAGRKEEKAVEVLGKKNSGKAGKGN